ncbi:uncharacterized protein [Drosophila pseudoobscura]|uniref:Uncharacterized protein n=1 Tax=Drosophila pseudoobscura pseudoobscura TaxID=46245 RepID=A0A6I8W5S7_DROPS|nr:uncharacterized protein LOC117184565 [Drosophila pseudoobscura]
MYTEAAQRVNSSSGVPEKSSLTGAATNMKKLLKSIRRIFTTHSKAGKDLSAIRHTCHSEEEHQNWLNEQWESSKICLH